jgi:hypothetical protein
MPDGTSSRHHPYRAPSSPRCTSRQFVHAPAPTEWMTRRANNGHAASPAPSRSRRGMRPVVPYADCKRIRISTRLFIAIDAWFPMHSARAIERSTNSDTPYTRTPRGLL